MPQQFSGGDEAVEAVKTLDLNNLTATLEWIDAFLEMEFNSPSRTALGTNSGQWQEITERFTNHGFTMYANESPNFIESDPLNHAGYIIGQFMAILTVFSTEKLSGAQFVIRLCEDWLKMFAYAKVT